MDGGYEVMIQDSFCVLLRWFFSFWVGSAGGLIEGWVKGYEYQFLSLALSLSICYELVNYWYHELL